MKKFCTFLLLFGLVTQFYIPTQAQTEVTHIIDLTAATLNGQALPEYDYTWHLDPTTDHGEVKNSPAEYYTGTKPSGNDPVYIAHDIFYYPQLEQSKFKQVNYDGETEWAYFYEAPGYENYILCTLPVLRTGFPSHMMHTPEEAYQNPVLYITKPGTYTLQGNWKGQVRVDLGEDAFDDPSQKVTLILNGADIACTVAPGVVFASVYECDNAWEDRSTYSQTVDTRDAGANVVIADGTVNHVSGTNVFRILKTKYKDENSTDPYPAQKKRLKTDGAFYSYQSMNINGSTGTLNITAGYEGLNTELHLTVNGGNVNIFSQDDGINVNEDDVSVVSINGGCLHICSGLGAEGDGIDSNGYLVINGGTVISAASQGADAGLDSDRGSFVNGGTVVSLGASMDWATADSAATQAVVNLRFSQSQNGSDAIIITDNTGKVVFAYDPDKDEVLSTEPRAYSGAVLSAPGLKVGSSYRIYVGGEITGKETAGVYDPATVTDFTNATQQVYSGNTDGNMGGMGGGQRPDMGGQRPDMGGQRPDMGGDPPQMPGNQGGMMPPDGTPPQGTPPNGMTPPDDMAPPQDFNPNGGNVIGATCTYPSEFAMTQTVNSFSNLSARRHELIAEGDHYRCSACNQTFADKDGTQPLTSQPEKAKMPTWLKYLLVLLAGCGITAAIFTAVLLLRKRK